MRIACRLRFIPCDPQSGWSELPQAPASVGDLSIMGAETMMTCRGSPADRDAEKVGGPQNGRNIIDIIKVDDPPRDSSRCYTSQIQERKGDRKQLLYSCQDYTAKL